MVALGTGADTSSPAKAAPVAENTLVVKERYEKLGGEIQVVSKPGVNHHPHSLKDPAPIVEFVLKHAVKKNQPATP